jgi:hypothetical protein
LALFGAFALAHTGNRFPVTLFSYFLAGLGDARNLLWNRDEQYRDAEHYGHHNREFFTDFIKTRTIVYQFDGSLEWQPCYYYNPYDYYHAKQ